MPGISLERALNDADKIGCLQAGAANQAAINIRLVEQFSRVAGFNRPTVKNAHTFTNFLAKHLA